MSRLKFIKYKRIKEMSGIRTLVWVISFSFFFFGGGGGGVVEEGHRSKEGE